MHTELCIDASRHRSPRITSVGGLAGRQTGPDTVHLIGTAATPLGGDTITVRISVAAGAHLEVRSVAASLAMPGALQRHSSAQWHFEIGAGASLVFDPEPMVVVSDASHSVVNTVVLQEDSTLWLRERTQIGRFDEASGRWSSSLRCDLGGNPLLRHRVELGEGSVAHDALSAPLSMSSTLQYPDTRASEVDLPGGSVRLALAGGGSLITSVGHRLQPAAR
ncbi:putative urease accessory protein UreD [Rhodococcus sp. AW25M09]|uniref:urease accessory protein UreD n=1 Tax=Rhodococcus sp. AW25M09 TaxID=1268303 RepID=UPI0002ACE4C8|nr:urease accessory protein UreD [Rhodococcus sp. AW25M09]CCQ16411.1 putative urease accessory protein UreD [Rhodococcus sp. AW25M09]